MGDVAKSLKSPVVVSFGGKGPPPRASPRVSSMEQVRIVVAEDDYLARSGLVALLESVPHFTVIGECATIDDLLDQVERLRPHLVVTDIRMPPTKSDEGIRAASMLRAMHPGVGVVVISHFVEPDYAVALVEHGSQGRGYLLKENLADLDHLVKAVDTVSAGGSSIDPTVVDTLIRSRRRQGPLSQLTVRELEVLAAVARGGSNSAIATELFITDRAVEKHINSIFVKLALPAGPDLNRRVAAVLVYLSAAPDGSGGPAGQRANGAL